MVSFPPTPQHSCSKSVTRQSMCVGCLVGQHLTIAVQSRRGLLLSHAPPIHAVNMHVRKKKRCCLVGLLTRAAVQSCPSLPALSRPTATVANKVGSCLEAPLCTRRSYRTPPCSVFNAIPGTPPPPSLLLIACFVSASVSPACPSASPHLHVLSSACSFYHVRVR